MRHHSLPGNPPVALVLRRSARARRLTLRVSSLDGRVTLTMPRWVSEAEALDFAREKESWLRAQLAKQVAPVVVTEDAEVLVEGVARRIVAGTGRAIAVDAGTITLRTDDGKAGPRLRAWLKERARARLAHASDGYARKLGLGYSRLTLRDTRSRWGSCSSSGALSYSWRLIMAPPDVLDYVAAHEVAHLAEMNHSERFWRVVEELYGPHSSQRRWLRTDGTALHRYVFDLPD